MEERLMRHADDRSAQAVLGARREILRVFETQFAKMFRLVPERVGGHAPAGAKVSVDALEIARDGMFPGEAFDEIDGGTVAIAEGAGGILAVDEDDLRREPVGDGGEVGARVPRVARTGPSFVDDRGAHALLR